MQNFEITDALPTRQNFTVLHLTPKTYRVDLPLILVDVWCWFEWSWSTGRPRTWTQSSGNTESSTSTPLSIVRLQGRCVARGPLAGVNTATDLNGRSHTPVNKLKQVRSQVTSSPAITITTEHYGPAFI